ncbi:hypothetical protein [Streptomyces sp. NPDC020996]|uniref:hypothetical protein n=1 Tax=Streptomyces sp. NPDC020996 TaxID=3154791 RepID=UPI0034030C64
MPGLADHDLSSLSIDPTGLSDSARKLLTHAKEVADTITAINNTPAGLALGWAGRTQEEMDRMNNQWTSTMRGLFGTKNAEMFQKFLPGLNSSGGSTPDSLPRDRTNVCLVDLTAITADW